MEKIDEPHGATADCRVLFVIGQLGVGGAEGQLRRLVAALRDRLDRVCVFALGRGMVTTGGTVLPKAPVIFGERRGAYDPLPLLRLRTAIRIFRPTAIVTFDRHAFLYSLIARFWTGSFPPIINRALETHGLVTRSAALQLGLARHWLRPQDNIVALSNALADYMKDSWGFPSEQIHVIPLGIDVSRFHGGVVTELRAPTRQALGIPCDTPVMIQVGNLSPNKNHEMALRLLAMVRSSGFLDCRLLVVGTGPEERQQALRALAENMKLDNHVIFGGVQADVRPFLAASDVLVLTSRAEATPNVVLESLACGVPVVVSAYASASEQLGPDLSYLSIPVEREAEFARRVCALLESASERERIGRLGQARVRACFSMERAVADWEKLICDCL